MQLWVAAAADIAKHVIKCSQNCYQGEEPLSLKARARNFHLEFFLSSAKHLHSIPSFAPLVFMGLDLPMGTSINLAESL